MFLEKLKTFASQCLLFSIGWTLISVITFIFVKQSPILAVFASVFYLVFQKKEFTELWQDKSYLAIFVRVIISSFAAFFVGGWIWALLFFRSLDNLELVVITILPVLSSVGSAIFCFIKVFLPESNIAKTSKQIYKGLYKMKILHDNTDPFLPKN